MRPRIRVIYNATAGREAFRAKLPEVLRILEESGLEASCHATKGTNDAREAAMVAAQDGFAYVVACGGDGTVNEVVNGLAVCDVRPTLGIIPAGTTNDLARALGLPLQIEEAAKLIASRRAMPLDLGRIRVHDREGHDVPERFFINIAACGRLTEITYDVTSRMKTMLGQVAYYIKGIELLPRVRPIDLRIESSSYVYDGQAMLCLITNSRSVAGFEKIAPNASVNDGKFDVLIVKPTNLGDMIRLVSSCMRGEHVFDERVVYLQSERITIFSDEEVDVNIDGEYGGELPAEIDVLASHLDVIVS